MLVAAAQPITTEQLLLVETAVVDKVVHQQLRVQ
jgi:hypothetical protein